MSALPLNKRPSGFTLLEVMLAFAVLAIAGLAMTQIVHQGVNNTRILKEKTLARWVADNELTSVVLKGRWPSESWQSYSVKLAKLPWFVRVRSVKTSNRDVREVQVEVRLTKDNQSAPAARLQTHMMRSLDHRRGRT